MYRKHFGLTRPPFHKEIVESELFASAALQELEIRLGSLVELHGIGLVTGESGSGKTSACRKKIASLHPGLYRVLYVPLTTGNPSSPPRGMADSNRPSRSTRASPASRRHTNAGPTRLTHRSVERIASGCVALRC